MNYRLHGVRLRYNRDSLDALKVRILQQLAIKEDDLLSFKIIRRSIDARKKPASLVYSIDIETKKKLSRKELSEVEPKREIEIIPGKQTLANPPVVVGAGPAGLFAAYILAKHGYKPILIERGQDIDGRHKAMKDFGFTRNANPESNALFGLGGAGTYSDGKLTTSLSHPIIGYILQTLVEVGAPEQILTDAKPHIGTDVLRGVVQNLANKIVELGGHIHTETLLTRINQSEGKITGVVTNKETIPTNNIILAIGHSARDTFESLHAQGIMIAPKPFQIGVRVEHSQKWLDKLQYGDGAGHPALGAADYKVTARIKQVPVFSFCMCPGGYTIPTVNEAEHLCVNGMSLNDRDGEFSSSGIVVTLSPQTYGGTDIASALSFVRSIENKCFKAGGADYSAPAQRLVDMIKGKKSDSIGKTSYAFGVKSVALNSIFPKFIHDPIVKALPIFEKRLPGFLHPDAVAIAPEARASNPLRILRDKESRESVTVSGLYPAGEGSGYAGGIMSAALDGINSAIKVIEKHAPF